MFDVLHMTDSSFLRPECSALSDNHDGAMAYKQELFPIDADDINKFPAISANSLRTTATDYARFMTALMNDKNMLHMFEAEISMTADRWAVDRGVSKEVLQNLAWGLGWGLQKNSKGKVISAFHWGDMNEWRTFAAMNLENKTGVVYFTNSKNGLLLADVITSPIVNMEPAFKYISEKLSFATKHEPHWQQKQQQRDNKTKEYLNSVSAHRAPKLSALLSANLGFFKKMENESLEGRRHKNPSLQREYDKRFGLVLKN